MPVRPYCKKLFQTRQDLYQFLLSHQQDSEVEDYTPIISISLETNRIDPLTVLHQIAQPHQPTFYFERSGGMSENQAGGVAIAAIGKVASLEVAGKNRFNLAKSFIQSTLARIIKAGDLQFPFTGPHFFCSFGFWDNTSAISPFSEATVFLPKWQISSAKNGSNIVFNIDINAEPSLELTVETIWQTLQTIESIQYTLLNPSLQNQALLRKEDVASTEQFKRAVSSALQSIQARVFHKIVLAHAVEIISPLPYHLVYSLDNLRRLYPDCYLFSISNGRGQYFLGASPERLVSLRDRQIITDALAGSAPRGKTTCEDAHLAHTLLNSPKETHEHHLVVQYITYQLQELGLAPHTSPLRLLQLSNIQHLHTPIAANVPSNTHLLDVVAKLHPTPAVAGMPREVACQHIQQYESFERSLYAAPIGWVDHQGNGDFAVGIRSALVDGDRARLYAGAGIVAGSDPEKELAEVQLKLQALLQALV